MGKHPWAQGDSGTHPGSQSSRLLGLGPKLMFLTDRVLMSQGPSKRTPRRTDAETSVPGPHSSQSLPQPQLCPEGLKTLNRCLDQAF